MDIFKRLIAIAVASCFSVNAATAETISFNVNDFLVSTTTTSGVNLSASPSSAPALPGADTFTLLPTVDANGVRNYLAQNEGKFVRYNFNLPASFSNLAFTFDAVVNDEFVTYVNGTVVAIQSSTGVDNFYPPLPGFNMNVAGVATDASLKLDYLLTNGIQPLFHAGANELSLYGTDTLLWGSIQDINGTIIYEAVPEPSIFALLGAGLCVVALRRRVNKA